MVFVKFDVLFVDIRHVLDIWKSQGLSLKEETVVFNFCVINGFHDFGNNFFSKKNKYNLILPVFLFVDLLPNINNASSHSTLSVIIDMPTNVF